jgi:hypothetical protein
MNISSSILEQNVRHKHSQHSYQPVEMAQPNDLKRLFVRAKFPASAVWVKLTQAWP